MSATNATRWTAKLAALDANLLVALDALLQEGNVTRAARRMGVTQPAMSQTLGRLRTQLDDPILVRVGRGMEPTPFARRIEARLRAAIAELEAVIGERPDFDPGTSERRFVLAMVDYLSLVWLPSLREAVARDAPGVDLAIRALDAGSIAGELEAGRVDLYVGVRGETERELVTEPLHRESLAVLVRADHPLIDAPSAEAYAAHPHVHVSPRREAGSIVDRALDALGLERRIAVEVPYFALVPSLLSGSDLIATVPERLGRAFEAAHPLRLLEAPIALPEIDIEVGWHPRFDGEPGLRWLRSVLAAVAADARR